MFKPNLSYSWRIVFKIVLVLFCLRFFLYLGEISRELIIEIKFNPNAVIQVGENKYLIKREPSEGSRDGYDYTVVKFDQNNQPTLPALERPFDIHSCSAIWQEGEYLALNLTVTAPGLLLCSIT